MGKRMYKTSEGAMLAGVCAGLAEYFSVDVTWIRLALVVVAAMGGTGVAAYIVAAIIMPDKSQVMGRDASRREPPVVNQTTVTWDGAVGQVVDTAQEQPQTEFRPVGQPQVHESGGGQRLFALILNGIGSYLLVNRYWDLSYIMRHYVRAWWPLLPILLGVALLASSFSRRHD